MFLTTLVVAVVAHTIVPGFPWAAAFVLGAIISPTDSVAATSIAQRLGIPRRIVTVLEGESLVNDGPIRPAAEIYNVKPFLEMKKRHEEARDATNRRERPVWGK